MNRAIASGLVRRTLWRALHAAMCVPLPGRPLWWQTWIEAVGWRRVAADLHVDTERIRARSQP